MNPLKLFDTHCHLNDQAFQEDQEEVILRAKEAGVNKMAVIGFDLPSSREAVRLAKDNDSVYAGVGIHPHDAESVTPETFKELEDLLRDEKVVALGETGLDYYYEHSPRQAQQSVFRQSLEMALRAGKPVIIHDREAHGDLLSILREAGREYWGVMHCYTGSREMARDLVRLGFFFSFAGPVTFKNAKRLAEVVKAIPDDRLLLETDAPYLAPHPFRGKRNEPSYLGRIAETLAEIRGASLEQIAKITWENACRFFNLSA